MFSLPESFSESYVQHKATFRFAVVLSLLSGLVPSRLLIDLIKPRSNTASFLSAPGASNTAPLISVDTPKAGSGLMSAAPHIANNVGCDGEGMGPISCSTFLIKAAALIDKPGLLDFRLVRATTSMLSYAGRCAFRREMMVTQVSTYVLQRQSNKDT